MFPHPNLAEDFKMGYNVLETGITMEINLLIHSIYSPSKHRFYHSNL